MLYVGNKDFGFISVYVLDEELFLGLVETEEEYDEDEVALFPLFAIVTPEFFTELYDRKDEFFEYHEDKGYTNPTVIRFDGGAFSLSLSENDTALVVMRLKVDNLFSELLLPVSVYDDFMELVAFITGLYTYAGVSTLTSAN